MVRPLYKEIAVHDISSQTLIELKTMDFNTLLDFAVIGRKTNSQNEEQKISKTKTLSILI